MKRALSALLLSILYLGFAGVVAHAQPMPSNHVLIPYFEVELLPEGRDTTFSVVNDDVKEIPLAISVYTNWGIPVLETETTVDPKAELTVRLSDWIRDGELPDRTLDADEMAHLQAALTGLPSPQDGLYYSSPTYDAIDEKTGPLAVGWVRVRVPGSGDADCLFGSYTIDDPSDRFSQGETLVNLDPRVDAYPICKRQAILYSECLETHWATELMIWTARRGHPHADAAPGPAEQVPVDLVAYATDGRIIDQREFFVLPTGKIDVCDLLLGEPFGWFELSSTEELYVTGHYTLLGDHSEALHGYCLPEAQGAPGPSIFLVKEVNGREAPIPPGPTIPVGDEVRWRYVVINNGVEPLVSIELVDDPEVEITCPETELEPGERMICTAVGVAEPCRFMNLARVTGVTPDGLTVRDGARAYYFGLADAEITLEKRTRGEDADQPPGPRIQVGDAVHWTYEVTNSGEGAVEAIEVTDDHGVAVDCPRDALAEGESMVCTAEGTAEPGFYFNVGTVRARSECGNRLVTMDPSHYFGWEPRPAIDVEKSTNGQDADQPPGPRLTAGSEVGWSYVVTNTGDTTLQNVTVTDDRGVAVTCPKTTLEPGEKMTCRGTGVAEPCQYANMATARGVPMGGGEAVTDTDPSHYYGEVEARVELEKLTLGEDADLPTGPLVAVGEPVEWSYVVTNTGPVDLFEVRVTDDRDVAVECPATTLAAGATMTCTAGGTAMEGQYRNVGTVTARPECGDLARATDPSHYFGQTEDEGDEGCTPGYWKNHVDSWEVTGYAPSQTVGSVFAGAASYPDLAAASLLEALSFGGGAGAEGAAEILLRAAVAAILNAQHPDVAYPWTAAAVISDVDAALASGDRDAMLLLAASLDQANNLGCPLN